MTPVTVATIRLLGDLPVLRFHQYGAFPRFLFLHGCADEILLTLPELGRARWRDRYGGGERTTQSQCKAKQSCSGPGERHSVKRSIVYSPRTRPLPRRISTSSKRRRRDADEAGARVRGGHFDGRRRATDSDTITQRMPWRRRIHYITGVWPVHVCPGDKRAWLFLEKSAMGDTSGAAKKRVARAIAFGAGAPTATSMICGS